MKAEESNISLLTVIAVRKQKDALIKAMINLDIHFISTTYAKGSVNASFLMKSFGFVSERNKVMITCISTNAKIKAFLEILVSEFDFNKPNTGVAFTNPIDWIAYTGGKQDEKK